MINEVTVFLETSIFTTVALILNIESLSVYFKPTLGFIDFFFYCLFSISFVSALICVIFFLLLTLSLVCPKV